MARLASALKEKKVAEKEKSDLAAELLDLQRLLDEEKKRSEGYLTRLRYLQAEFDNYRKRVDREFREIEEFSLSGMIGKLLLVLDELDLAIASAEAQGDKSSFIEGVKMVAKRLNSILQAEGLKRIDAVGKPFDPAIHEAVDKVQGTRKGEDLVVEEIRKGFSFKDRVLRPSMVKVELGLKNHDENNRKNVESAEGKHA